MSRRHNAVARFESTATQLRGYRFALAGTRVLSCEFPHQACEILECHRSLVRTGIGASVGHFICERARRAAADAIGVETVIPGGNDQRAVAVNVDTIRSRAGPGQVHSPSTAYQVATRTKCDLARPAMLPLLQ